MNRKIMQLTVVILICLVFKVPLNGETPEAETPWDIKAGFGFNLTAGNNDTRVFDFDTNAKKYFNSFRYNGIIRIARGTTSYSGGPRIETVNNWLINSRVDWFTTARRVSFLFALISLDGNEFSGYWSRRSAQFGYGIEFFTLEESIDFNIAVGVDYSKDNLVVKNDSKDEFFSAVLKPELEWKILPDITIGFKSNFFMDFQDAEEYRFDINNFVNLKLSDRLSLRSTYTLLYRNKPLLINELDQVGQPTGENVPAKPSDHIITTSILLNF